jgi:hypothetical protein
MNNIMYKYFNSFFSKIHALIRKRKKRENHIIISQKKSL